MKVLKFGGSSVGSPANIKQVSNIISDYINSGEQIIVVTSAMQGITNELIEVGKLAAADDESYSDLSDKIVNHHLNAIKELIDIKSQSSIIAQLKFLTNNLEDLLHGVFLLKELLFHLLVIY